MLDFLIRSFKHPLDYLGIIKLHTLHLIRTEQESDQIYSFIFTVPDGLEWKSGQHGIFWFLYDRIKGNNWRAFSIASSPMEKGIRITTTITAHPSEFKQTLTALQPGDTITLQGPFGEFHVTHDMKHAVGVAGGIGITPFRAMLHQIACGTYPGFHLTLIYSASHNLYTFKETIEQYAASPQIDIIYTETPDEVNAELSRLIDEHQNQAHYFISGSPGMIKALRKSIISQGVAADHIINDPFKGY